MKVVMIIDQQLPLGIVANTAAVLGMSLSNQCPDIIGSEVNDQDQHIHYGITEKNIPVLGVGKEDIKKLRNRLFKDEFPDIKAIDFTTVALRSREYESYRKTIALIPANELEYLGIALIGPEKKVNKLTGNMPLLR